MKRRLCDVRYRAEVGRNGRYRVGVGEYSRLCCEMCMILNIQNNYNLSINRCHYTRTLRNFLTPHFYALLVLVVLAGVREADMPGHNGGHPRPQVADRGTPSRMARGYSTWIKKESRVADKQCLGEGKLLFQTGADGARLASSGKSI